MITDDVTEQIIGRERSTGHLRSLQDVGVSLGALGTVNTIIRATVIFEAQVATCDLCRKVGEVRSGWESSAWDWRVVAGRIALDNDC